MVGETEIESGEAATWEDGENTVTITVEAEGATSTTYTVVVTKTTESGPEPPVEE